MPKWFLSKLRITRAWTLCALMKANLSVRDFARMVSDGLWDPAQIGGLVYKDKNGAIVRTPPQELVDVNAIPYHPYDLLDLKRYFVSSIKGYASPAEAVRIHALSVRRLSNAGGGPRRPRL